MPGRRSDGFVGKMGLKDLVFFNKATVSQKKILTLKYLPNSLIHTFVVYKALCAPSVCSISLSCKQLLITQSSFFFITFTIIHNA